MTVKLTTTTRGINEMTAAELQWWKLFKRIVKAMPKSLEVSVHQSSIAVSKTGSRQAAFERDGHADQTEDLDFFKHARVYPNSESL